MCDQGSLDVRRDLPSDLESLRNSSLCSRKPGVSRPWRISAECSRTYSSAFSKDTNGFARSRSATQPICADQNRSGEPGFFFGVHRNEPNAFEWKRQRIHQTLVKLPAKRGAAQSLIAKRFHNELEPRVGKGTVHLANRGMRLGNGGEHFSIFA